MLKDGSTSFEMFAQANRVRMATASTEEMANAIVRQAAGDQRSACALLDDLQETVNRKLREGRA